MGDTNAANNLSAIKRLSILHVGKYYPPFAGGMEQFLFDLLDALSSRGVQTAAIVHDHEFCLKGRAPHRTATDVTASENKASDSEVQVYRAPSLGRVLYAPVSPQFPLWLRRAIRAERPDILHLHLPNTSAFWALCLPEARGIPWVIHWHADVVSSDIDRRLKLAYPLYRPFEQRLLRHASRVIVTSPTYLDGSEALSPWRDKCSAVPLGINPLRIPAVSTEARASAETYWVGKGLRIVSVGRLTYYKGHRYLIDALKNLPDAQALIVGEGECRRDLEKLIQDLNLDRQVALTGKLSAEDLHGVLSSCDCLCLPSIERTEAFGLVIVEAMAHGKATVVSDVPGSGMGWIVEDGKTGRIVPPADSEALCVALRALSGNRGVLSSMGLEGWRRYQKLFGIDRVSEEILRLYEKVLNRGFSFEN